MKNLTRQEQTGLPVPTVNEGKQLETTALNEVVDERAGEWWRLLQEDLHAQVQGWLGSNETTYRAVAHAAMLVVVLGVGWMVFSRLRDAWERNVRGGRSRWSRMRRAEGVDEERACGDTPLVPPREVVDGPQEGGERRGPKTPK